MSRNGPIGYAGTRPPARRPLPDDPFTAPPTGQGAPQWPPQPASYQQQPAYVPQQAPSYPPQPAYPQAQPAHGQPPNYGQQAYGAQEGHGQQQGQGYYFPQGAAEPEPAPGYAPGAQRWGQQPDPRGYDLGTYMPTAQGYPPAEPAHFQHGPDAAQLQHHAELDPAGLQRPNDTRLDAPPHGYGETDADFDEMLADEEEEPRRGRRAMMIAAALVGAIGLGGAMAYTYKTFVASSGTRAPVIKAADFGPNKVKPVVQDGKSFANTDKKLLNRLGEDGSAAPSSSVGALPPSAPEAADERASDDPNAPRKVRVIPITPGSPPVTTSSAPPRPSSPPPLVSVPGVTLENFGAQPPPSAARVQLPPAQPQPPARAVQQPPVKVASAARTEPPALPAAEPAAPMKKAATAAVRTPVPKTKTAAVEPTAPTTATSGYVAVLSSKKSRMDALKAFADMRDKYGDVLASRTPDVQEVNLGEKGVWYRAVVGPPGSREAALGLCSQLKSAGYASCWVTAY
jgi:sporulation related protein